MHCEICDYCETTGTPSNYYTEFHIVGNKVKYRPLLERWLCDECVSSSKWIKNTYKLEEIEKGLIDDEQFRDYPEDNDDEPIPKDAPAMSEM